jgi:hypothetical protein
MSTRTKTPRRNLATAVIFAALPGPTRKRAPSPYCFRLIYQNPDPAAPGCALSWDVLGGREVYQIALERLGSGKWRWHCTCADAVYRGDNPAHVCKHIRGLQGVGREKFELHVPGS